MEAFEIPRKSFTAFRLSYLSTPEISTTSKSVVLGKFPYIWFEDEGHGLLSETVRSAKDKARKALDDSGSEDEFEVQPIVDISSVNRVATNYTYTEMESALTEATVVMRQSRRFKKKMSVATPEPIIGFKEDIVKAEREHRRLRKKFKKLASRSTGRAKRSTKNLGYRIYRSVIRSYRVGEVILKERVLLMVKETNCDTRVNERWREVSIVLRKLAGGAVALQMYKIDDRKESEPQQWDEEKPEVEYELDSEVTANFYSVVDKSLSINIQKSHWCTINIIKFHSQTKSVRWLYFIKQVLGHTFPSDFNIHIPDIGLTLDISLPESMIIDTLRESKHMKIEVLRKDYKVTHSPLIQHLLNEIFTKLGESNDPKVIHWLSTAYRPWFCFRNYDRLEWPSDESEMFFIQNQVFRDYFQLELRTIVSEKRFVEMESIRLEEPTPIEGFLSRLTNSTGNEQSIIRAFYKVQYFSTCDNLLFFTKYYRSTPPAVKMEGIEVFENCEYELDDSNHIDWLDSTKFLMRDRDALVEFQRRGQLIVKADSVIDLTSVVDIQPVELKKIKLAHRVLLGVLWYSNASLVDDEFITDSVFEITTLNGSKIRLQAPNRLVRDEWIRRLTDIRNYWDIKKQDQTERFIQLRKRNMQALKINEYVDSNINQEYNVVALERSQADPYLHAIDSLAICNHLMMSGYLYEKYKKHSNFNRFFVVLSSGKLILYSLYKRSKLTGEWKTVPYFHHELTIALPDCYVYSGFQTESDLVQSHQTLDSSHPGYKALPRIYVDGWKSQEEESVRCFTLWFGRKRSLRTKHDKSIEPRNPNLVKIVSKLGITGQSIVLMARSRQEREMWVSRIDAEIDRYSRLYNL
ncbi:hypothetical protein CANTEDRAFT_125099 [Yamadazyma tenuis ATCC 10573]|uniref:PH domain-containing protein n=1 Tax=Candida tenuis (strain ATCC 10573 / BCRC 21748 / CBS 615 / JCM 9827 / NBRC 10315 / NRRL Y-1498 / VKM Y-70) TaxID=590646 RepID=G3B9B4_CANTC|nr:uncharacterized protein CANTEDRAFT_125099 [Yamadazyma tenuis ATCC 10573]EGV61859.1 hypothetical protein CANTEDRAFT_125099 [Yamadazyma tenuis ATCC 10573]